MQPGHHIRFEGKDWTILNAAYFIAPTEPIEIKPAEGPWAAKIETSFDAVPYVGLIGENKRLTVGARVKHAGKPHQIMGAAYWLMGGNTTAHKDKGLSIQMRFVTHEDLKHAKIISTEEVRAVEVASVV